MVIPWGKRRKLPTQTISQASLNRYAFKLMGPIYYDKLNALIRPKRPELINREVTIMYQDYTSCQTYWKSLRRLKYFPNVASLDFPNLEPSNQKRMLKFIWLSFLLIRT